MSSERIPSEMLAQAEAVLKAANRFDYVLKQFWTPLIYNNGNVEKLAKTIMDALTGLLDSLQACPMNSPEIDNLRFIAECADNMGFTAINPNPLTGQRILPPELPGDVITKLQDATKALAERIELQIDHDLATKEAERAVTEGVFPDWVQRNPGRGAVKQIGPFTSDEALDLFGKPYLWRSQTAYFYAHGIWMLEDCRVDTVFKTHQRQFTIVPEAQVARLVCDSTEPVAPELLSWAKKIVLYETEPTLPVPKWDSERRKLYYKDKPVRSVSKGAMNVIHLLSSLETKNWPKEMQNPFKNTVSGRRQLIEAVRSLNKLLADLRFEALRNGTAVTWCVTCSENRSTVFPFDL